MGTIHFDCDHILGNINLARHFTIQKRTLPHTKPSHPQRDTYFENIINNGVFEVEEIFGLQMTRRWFSCALRCVMCVRGVVVEIDLLLIELHTESFFGLFFLALRL